MRFLLLILKKSIEINIKKNKCFIIFKKYYNLFKMCCFKFYVGVYIGSIQYGHYLKVIIRLVILFIRVFNILADEASNIITASWFYRQRV